MNISVTAGETARGATKPPAAGPVPFEVEELGARLGAEIHGLDLKQGMDPATRWLQVDLDKVPASPGTVLGEPGQATALLTSLLLRGAVGAAAEMLGASRRCLDMAVGYAKVRDVPAEKMAEVYAAAQQV